MPSLPRQPASHAENTSPKRADGADKQVDKPLETQPVSLTAPESPPRSPSAPPSAQSAPIPVPVVTPPVVTSGTTKTQMGGAAPLPPRRGGKKPAGEKPVASAMKAPATSSSAPLSPKKSKSIAGRKRTIRASTPPGSSRAPRVASKAVTVKATVPAASQTTKQAPKKAAVKKAKAAKPALRVKPDAARKAKPVKSTPANALPGMSLQDIFALGRANVDAVLESSVTMFMGVQDYQTQCWDFACESLEQGVETGASLLQCASAKDAMEMQQSFIEDGVKRWVQTSQDLSEISSVTAQDVLSPLSRGLEAIGAHDAPTPPSQRA